MNYAEALKAVHAGNCVAHVSWKLCFIYLVQGSEFVVNRAPLNKLLPEGTVVKYAPHVDKLLLNHDGSVTAMVWEGLRPSTRIDVLDDEWRIVTFEDLQSNLAKVLSEEAKHA
jgi:hypothetical protein